MSHDAYDASPYFKRYTRDADNRYKRHKRHGRGFEAVVPDRPAGSRLLSVKRPCSVTVY